MSSTNLRLLAGVVACTVLLAPLVVRAGDILIDPAKVSDAETHFMVKIMESGHYRLTADLTVPDADTTAIEINADDVVVDLGGFSIRGPVVCSTRASCQPTGAGNGVHAVWRNNIVVRNGSISGMGNVGIYLETNTARIEKVRLESNAGGGAVLFGGTIADSIVQGNGNDGVIGLDTRMLRSAVRANHGYGFKAYGNSSYVGSTFSGNNGNQAQIGGKARGGKARGGNTCKGGGACP